MRFARPASVLSVLFLLAAPIVSPPLQAAAAAGDVKESMKKAGEGIKKFGRKVGEAGKEAGQEIAEASKKVWFKGKQVSARLLKRTQSATREWWEEVLEGKERTLRELRRENARLKKRLEESE